MNDLIETMTDAYVSAAEADGKVIGRDVVTVRMRAVLRAMTDERGSAMTDEIDDLLERLRDLRDGGHDRGCAGRDYRCDCGYDTRVFFAMDAASGAIRSLRAQLAAATEREKALGEALIAVGGPPFMSTETMKT